MSRPAALSKLGASLTAARSSLNSGTLMGYRRVSAR